MRKKILEFSLLCERIEWEVKKEDSCSLEAVESREIVKKFMHFFYLEFNDFFPDSSKGLSGFASIDVGLERST